MPPKGLQHKRDLAARKRRQRGAGSENSNGGRTVQPLKSKTARKRGGEIFRLKQKPEYRPVKKRARGPGTGKMERDLDRMNKENARRSDDEKLRRALRGTVGEVVAQVTKPGEIVMFVRNAEGGLDRRTRTRSDA